MYNILSRLESVYQSIPSLNFLLLCSVEAQRRPFPQGLTVSYIKHKIEHRTNAILMEFFNRFIPSLCQLLASNSFQVCEQGGRNPSPIIRVFRRLRITSLSTSAHSSFTACVIQHIFHRIQGRKFTINSP